MPVHSWIRLLKPARRLRPLLHVALFILAIAAGVALLKPPGVPTGSIESVYGVLLLAMLFSLVNLLGIWAALGTARWAVRMFELLIGLAVVEAIMLALWQHEATAILALVLELALVGLLSLARWRGLQFCLEAAPAGSAAVQASGRAQFSLGDLALWTVGFAAVFGVAHHMQVDVVWLRSELFALFAFVSGFCFLVVCTLWAVFGATRWPVRVVTLVLTVGAVGEWIWRSEGGAPAQFRPWIYACMGLQALIMAGVLLILRWHGYRLERKPASGSPDTCLHQ